MGDLEDWQYRSGWADGTTFTAEDLKTLGLKEILKRRKKEMDTENSTPPIVEEDVPGKRGPKPDYPGPSADIPAAENVTSHQQVILQCKTVGEALNRLSALTSPGSGADIRLAVKNEVIELKKE